MQHPLLRYFVFLVFSPLLLVPGPAFGEASLERIEEAGGQRLAEGQRTQDQIDALSDRSRELVDQYQDQLKLVQGLETYIDLLDQQLDGQGEEIAALEQSITDVAVIERQVLPLMQRMIQSLDAFVSLDLPFLLAERQARVDKLKVLLGRSDVTVAEKCRRVFEAYQIENEFGRTIEAYTAKLELDGATYDAEFLRIGRIGLLYRSVGRESLGYWDSSSGRWEPLEQTPWARMIDQGLKVARQEVAPQLVHVNLSSEAVVAR